MEKIIEKAKENFEKILENFLEEINKIRAGRPTPALVEDLVVEAYGVKTPLKQVASISVQPPRTILIEPWDKNIIKEIEKALSESNLNANISISGASVRAILPELSAERRSELIKIIHDKKEDARVSIRNIREKAWQEIQDKEENKELTEDDKFRLKDELQEAVDDYNKKIDENADKKEEELKTI